VPGLGLWDPDTFLDGPPHDLLTELRHRDPVHHETMADGSDLWLVLRHRDVVKVARDSASFSASLGGVVIETLAPEQVEAMRGMLLAMDPPKHLAFRKPVAPHFRKVVIEQLEPRIRSVCGQILDDVPRGEVVEFVHDVTADLPTRVIGELMGLPEEDWSYIHKLAEQNTSGQDSDYAGDEPQDGMVQMALYAIQLAQRRRAEEPAPDLTSVILGTEFDGHLMDDIEFATFFVQLVTAGNDTTKTMLSSGVLALLEHPVQLHEVRDDPTLIPSAVEEILRWANPLHYFRRTTTRDSRLGNVTIPEGHKVAMYYTSANRDEELFEDSQRFDIHRSPNPHLSFGIAEHHCLGVHLARLEGRVFFEELLGRFPDIALAGSPVRLRSNLNNAYKHIPVQMR
jgi:cytochrome P450